MWTAAPFLLFQTERIFSRNCLNSKKKEPQNGNSEALKTDA